MCLELILSDETGFIANLNFVFVIEISTYYQNLRPPVVQTGRDFSN